ncbi:MAG: TIGR00730 family Rossman fold protein, partial [Nitrospinaceae bacterium]
TNRGRLKAVCVYCASSEKVGEPYRAAARELGRLLGTRGIELVYGGAAIGLMGEVARGVHDRGGSVVGVLPRFFMKKGIRYDEADDLIVTRDMRQRKAIMDERAAAFIVLPGGIGTLEEAMEILSMVQLKLTAKPLVFINTCGFFDEILAHFKKMVDLDFAKPQTLEMFGVVPGPREALDYINRVRSPEGGSPHGGGKGR